MRLLYTHKIKPRITTIFESEFIPNNFLQNNKENGRIKRLEKNDFFIKRSSNQATLAFGNGFLHIRYCDESIQKTFKDLLK
ncbi:MAG TPA: hypothetical protein DCR42_02415 [Flavobacteriaceae bacterium]|nr:hypothetical protein [Flavobacteriaceae bacterium]